MSPTIETCRPLKLFLLRRIVKASSSACEGCSCSPSPALMTGTSTCCAITQGAHRVTGVQQRFALLNARTHGLDEHGVSAHQLRRDFKRAARAGRSFVEKKQDPLPLEQGTRLVRIHAPGKLQKS